MMMVLIEKQRGERMKEKVERLMRKNEKTRKIDKKEGGWWKQRGKKVTLESRKNKINI